MSITIAVVAQGMMGSGVGKRLHERGAEVRTLLSGRSAASAERARAAGMKPAADEKALLDGADFFLSILPPGEAEALARQLAPALAALEEEAGLCRLQCDQPADRRARRRDHRADRRQIRRWRDHRRAAARRATARRFTPRVRRSARPRCCAIGGSTGAPSTGRSAPPRGSRCPMPGSPRASPRSARR